VGALIPILFVALFVSAICGLALQWTFLSRLRGQHLPTWEALGRPTLFLNNSIMNSTAVLRFLWRRGYRTLGDEQLARLGNFLRCYLAAYLLFFMVVIVLFAIFLVSVKSPK